MVLRPAGSSDAAAIAYVWLRSFDAALPTVGRAQADAEVRDWIGDVLVPQKEPATAHVGGLDGPAQDVP